MKPISINGSRKYEELTFDQDVNGKIRFEATQYDTSSELIEVASFSLKIDDVKRLRDWLIAASSVGRPADTVSNAIRVAKILTGEIEEDMGDSGKDKAAQSLGRKGGVARAKKLSPEDRAAIARKAAAARWKG
jgi:hypothetical protein